MVYENRVVAFIDILGFTKTIQNSTEEDAIKILETLEELKRRFIDDRKKFEPLEGFDTQIVQVSDSLVISQNADQPGGIADLLEICSFVIHALINHGYLCRGAIKIGKLYHKGSILFGEAFIRAYEAEREEWKPIVKFDNELFEIARLFPGMANIGYEEEELISIKKKCKEIHQGVFYLDYFNDYQDLVGGSGDEHYSKLRKIITSGLKKSTPPRVIEKNNWAAKQFNKIAYNYNLKKIYCKKPLMNL